MPRRIVIVQGHPDAHPRHLCHAFGAAYARGAEQAGHAVARIDIAALDFPWLRDPAEFLESAPPAVLAPAVEAIKAADHLVLIFPLWLGTMPALLKAFLEQVMRPGTAFANRRRGFPERLMTGKSVRIIVTMGMPSAIYRVWFGAHGVRSLERSILRFVGFGPVRRVLFGMVDAVGPRTRENWRRQIQKMGMAGR